MEHEYERPSVDVADLPPQHAAVVPSRRTPVRLAMFAGLVGALVTSVYAVGLTGATTVDRGGYATDAAYLAAVDHATAWTYLLCLPLIATFFAVAAPKVSYRSRDALMLLVPVWSYVFAGRVLWRLTGLAERRWPHRVDEFDTDALTTGAY